MIIDDGEFSIWNCVVLKLKAQFASHKLRRPKKKKKLTLFLIFHVSNYFKYFLSCIVCFKKEIEKISFVSAFLL